MNMQNKVKRNRKTSRTDDTCKKVDDAWIDVNKEKNMLSWLMSCLHVQITLNSKTQEE